MMRSTLNSKHLDLSPEREGQQMLNRERRLRKEQNWNEKTGGAERGNPDTNKRLRRRAGRGYNRDVNWEFTSINNNHQVKRLGAEKKCTERGKQRKEEGLSAAIESESEKIPDTGC